MCRVLQSGCVLFRCISRMCDNTTTVPICNYITVLIQFQRHRWPVKMTYMKRVLLIHPCKANESSSVLKQVDDILGEESDNESEGQGKDKPGNEEDEEQQQPGPTEVKCKESGPQALGLDERMPEPSSENSILGCVPR